MAKISCLWVVTIGDDGPALHLARRAAFKDETCQQPQSYANTWQPPVHGKQEGEEVPLETMLREAKEEGGQEFIDRIQRQRVRALSPSIMNPDLTSFIVICPPILMENFKPCPAIAEVRAFPLRGFPPIETTNMQVDKQGAPEGSFKMCADLLEALDDIRRIFNVK